MHYYLIGLLSVTVLIILFLSSGTYFSLKGAWDAIYQLSLLVAILPTIAFSWMINTNSTESKMDQFLESANNRTITILFILFLLVGAFNEVTKTVGSIEAATQCLLAIMPTSLLLVTLFIAAALVTAAVGNAVAAIATIAPIAVGISDQLGFSPILYVATVISGATLGENLSPIYNTTLPTLLSQEIDAHKKFKLKATLALIAAGITVLLLLMHRTPHTPFDIQPYPIILMVPYLLLLLLAFSGVHIFVSLFVSIMGTALVGWCVHPDYNVLTFFQSVQRGFASTYEIMVLTLLVAGLAGISAHYFTQRCATWLTRWLKRRRAGQRLAQLVIGFIAGLFDVLLGNGAVALMLSGDIAQTIAHEYAVPAHYSSVWLEIFTSIFQAIIPYGAHILIASSIAGVSPLSIMPHVYYSYVLGAVSVVYILIVGMQKSKNNAKVHRR